MYRTGHQIYKVLNIGNLILGKKCSSCYDTIIMCIAHKISSTQNVKARLV